MNQLVADLSAQDNLNQACSERPLLLPLCHHDDLLLVGPAPRDPDHRCIDEQVRCSGVVVTGWTECSGRLTCVLTLSQLQGCSAVGGASLDNDTFSLCDSSNEVPAPPTVPVALTVAAVQLFGVVFPYVISAQRYLGCWKPQCSSWSTPSQTGTQDWNPGQEPRTGTQDCPCKRLCFLFRVKILEQFVETVKTVKGQRHQTAQTHICAALCSLLKVQQPGVVQGSSSTLSPRSYTMSACFSAAV